MITSNKLAADKSRLNFSDEGNGIDVEGIKEVNKGNHNEMVADYMSENEIISFIYQSGLSTNCVLNDVSCGELGLAILKEKIEKFQGVIKLNTKKDVGTTFSIIVPMRIFYLKVLLVRANKEKYIIPFIYIKWVLRVRQDKLEQTGNNYFFHYENKKIPVVKLFGQLEPYDADKTVIPQHYSALVLGIDEKKIILVVDDILQETELYRTKINGIVSNAKNISSNAILDKGNASLILNIPDIISSALRTTEKDALVPGYDNQEKVLTKTILVVDDSITSRTVIKNILEAAGFNIITSVDGREAYSIMNSEKIDLLVSDVNMPNLNGFELTEKVRKNENLANMPVILVTSLQSKTDREHGMEVGANAYIIKSSFDRVDFLRVIRELI